MVVLKRCVDVDDLLAAVTAGQADVAVLSLDAPGLDPATVAHLRRHAVRPVAVTAALRRGLAPASTPGDWGSPRWSVEGTWRRCHGRSPTVEDVADTRVRDDVPVHDLGADHLPAADPGRLVVASGARPAPPGARRSRRLAASWRGATRRSLLADADPYGGAVAQQLGILDEVSGLLVRLPAGRRWSARRPLPLGLRGVGDPGRASPACRGPIAGPRCGPAPSSSAGAGARARSRRGRHRLQPRGRPGADFGWPPRAQRP